LAHMNDVLLCFFCFHSYACLLKCQLASVIVHLMCIAFHAAWKSGDMGSIFAAAARACMFVCVLTHGHASLIAAITCWVFCECTHVLVWLCQFMHVSVWLCASSCMSQCSTVSVCYYCRLVVCWKFNGPSLGHRVSFFSDSMLIWE